MKIYRSDNHLSVTMYIKHEIAVDDAGKVKWGDTASKMEVDFAVEDVKKMATQNLPEGFYQKFTQHDHFVLLNATSEPGAKWPITEEIYNYFLDILPPMYCTNGFYISEANGETAEGVIRSKYYKEGGRYWHEYVLIPHKENDRIEEAHY